MKRLYIVNLLSERVARKGSVLEPLSAVTGVRCFLLDPFDALPSAVSKAAEDEIEHVIIEGGDGTVQGVISAFLYQADKFKKFPAFTLIPGGMTNQVAKNIGLKSAKAKAVETALSKPLKPIEIPLLNVMDAAGPSYAGFLLSTGVIPQITRYTTSNLHSKGVGGSLAVLGGIIKGIRGNDDTLMRTTPVEIDGLHTGPHLGTVVTTLPGLILGLDPFWGPQDAPLRVTWVEENYRKLGRNILSLRTGNKSKDRSKDGLHSKSLDSLTYRYAGDVVLDGEFLSFPSGKFTVRPTRHVTFFR